MDRRLPLIVIAAFCVALVLLVVIEEGYPGGTLTNPTIKRTQPSGLPPGLDWSQVAESAAPPTASGMIAYFPPAQELVLLTSAGGCTGSATWVFADDVWVNLTDRIGPGPDPARTDGGLVYDPSLGALVLFGGSSPCGVYNDTWTFANDTWSLLPTTDAPPPLYGFAMTYDAADGYVLLTGGCCVNGSDSHETWGFASGVWTNLTQTPAPVVDLDSAMTYDADLDEVVYLGGYASGFVSQATWTFHDGLWKRLYPSPSPSNRAGMGLSYDASLGRVVLLGGYTKIATDDWQNLSDTWVYGSHGWSNVTAELANAPPFVSGPTLMTYDPALGETVLFLGAAGTWALGV